MFSSNVSYKVILFGEVFIMDYIQAFRDKSRLLIGNGNVKVMLLIYNKTSEYNMCDSKVHSCTFGVCVLVIV